MIKVIFVCLGNICRSPMAEGVFQKMVDDAGLSDHFQVDSAGTSSWHIGEPAHRGTREILAKHGISYTDRARCLRSEDYNEQNYLIAMDKNNLAELRRHSRRDARMFLLLDFSSQSETLEVPDPYYHDNFQEVYRLVEDGCRGLLTAIRDAEGI